jgi:hypothetical protein
VQSRSAVADDGDIAKNEAPSFARSADACRQTVLPINGFAAAPNSLDAVESNWRPAW